MNRVREFNSSRGYSAQLSSDITAVDDDTEGRLRELLSAQASSPAGLRFSIWVERISPTPAALFQYAAERSLRSASAAKLLILSATARAIESGELSASQAIERTALAPVRDAGVWWHLRQQTLAVEDLAKLVGTVSDNLAANGLITALGGVERVATLAQVYNPGDVALLDLVRAARTPTDPPTLSTGSASGYASLLKRLWSASKAGDPAALRVLSWLQDGADLSMVAGAFKLDPLAHHVLDQQTQLWHKTGSDIGVRADVGLVTIDAKSYAYACLINWRAAGPVDPARADALRVMTTVGELLLADRSA